MKGREPRQSSEPGLMSFGVRERDLPMECLRHSDRPCYLREGHGGRAIEAWPIYRFFAMYAEGETERAHVEFANWYRQQFMKYRDVPKRIGGMRDGSLARTIGPLTDRTADAKTIPDTDEGGSSEMISAALHEAVDLRVKQRFQLVDSIRGRGYVPTQSDPVLGIRKADGVYLEGGHHRAAALKALGWTELPGVLVFPDRLHYAAWRWLWAIRHSARSGRIRRWCSRNRLRSEGENDDL